MNVAIACGGTGGHLFPGIAVAEVLQERGHQVLLLISEKQVDATAVRDWVHDKHHEARVIVAGERIFPVLIHAGSAASRMDWRTDYPALRYGCSASEGN